MAFTLTETQQIEKYLLGLENWHDLALFSLGLDIFFAGGRLAGPARVRCDLFHRGDASHSGQGAAENQTRGVSRAGPRGHGLCCSLDRGVRENGRRFFVHSQKEEKEKSDHARPICPSGQRVGGLVGPRARSLFHPLHASNKASAYVLGRRKAQFDFQIAGPQIRSGNTGISGHHPKESRRGFSTPSHVDGARGQFQQINKAYRLWNCAERCGCVEQLCALLRRALRGTVAFAKLINLNLRRHYMTSSQFSFGGQALSGRRTFFYASGAASGGLV